MELDNIKKSRLIIGFIKIGISFSVFFLILQIYVLISEFELKHTGEVLETFNEYYEFEPNSFFSKEARERFESYTTENIEKNNAIIYTEYLSKWIDTKDIEILRLQPYVFSMETDMKVYTYISPGAFENSWDDFILPLKEGRWFEADKNEVICISGGSYEIGDEIQIRDKSDENFTVTVVGKVRYPYLYNNISMTDALNMAVYKFDDTEDILLLNPQSVYNRKSDLVNYRTTFIKTNNEAFISEISEYGSCIPVKEMIIKQKENILAPLVIMIISALTCGILSSAEVLLNCYKGTGWCITIGGILSYIAGSILFAEVEYKLVVSGIVCILIIMVSSLVVKCVHREKKKKDISGCDIIVMNTEDVET